MTDLNLLNVASAEGLERALLYLSEAIREAGVPEVFGPAISLARKEEGRLMNLDYAGDRQAELGPVQGAVVVLGSLKRVMQAGHSFLPK